LNNRRRFKYAGTERSGKSIVSDRGEGPDHICFTVDGDHTIALRGATGVRADIKRCEADPAGMFDLSLEDAEFARATPHAIAMEFSAGGFGTKGWLQIGHSCSILWIVHWTIVLRFRLLAGPGRFIARSAGPSLPNCPKSNSA
jgi:hypothetical protein